MNKLTSGQIRAARALLRIDQADLAKQAGISVETVKRLEKMSGAVSATDETVDKIRSALSRQGVEFIDFEDPFLEPGVRLWKEDPDWVRRAVETAFANHVQFSIELAYRSAPALSKEPVEKVVQIIMEHIEWGRPGLVKTLRERIAAEKKRRSERLRVRTPF